MDPIFMEHPNDLSAAMIRGRKFFQEHELCAHILEGNCLLNQTAERTPDLLTWEMYTIVGQFLILKLYSEEEAVAYIEVDEAELVGKMTISGDSKFSAWLETNRVLHSDTNRTKDLPEDIWEMQED